MKYMLLRLIDIFVLLIIVIKTLLHEYNLLKIMMKYNLLNIVTFKELPKIIKKLYVIHDDYEYFSTASVNIIIDLTITVLNCTANVITFDGELIRLGDYARRESVKYGMNRDRLLDFIQIVDGIRRKMEYDNHDLLQNK